MQTESDSGRAQRRVLIAEDNPILLKMIVFYLTTLKIAFDTVANGQDVLASLERQDYCLVLMDCKMPELDGYEATRLIRRHSSKKIRDIPIVGVTSRSAENDEIHCLRTGMNDFLAKPLRLRSLQKMFCKWLPDLGANEQD